MTNKLEYFIDNKKCFCDEYKDMIVKLFACGKDPLAYAVYRPKGDFVVLNKFEGDFEVRWHKSESEIFLLQQDPLSKESVERMIELFLYDDVDAFSKSLEWHECVSQEEKGIIYAKFIVIAAVIFISIYFLKKLF